MLARHGIHPAWANEALDDPDRAKVLSVRLNTKEYEQLAARAELAGVGPSTLARSMVRKVVNPRQDRAPNDAWVTSVSERLAMLEARIGAEG
ncbi:MAG: hypothetical protein HHJ13_00405 [Phycicoccus sp.]|nr:hypothetical protein [Phycicoccus sp.]